MRSRQRHPGRVVVATLADAHHLWGADVDDLTVAVQQRGRHLCLGVAVGLVTPDDRPPRPERQLDARRRVHKALQALGGLSSPAGSCVWHVVGLQRSVREWAIRQGWGGRPVRQEQAQGILIAALGVLAQHFGYCNASRSRQLAHT